MVSKKTIYLDYNSTTMVDAKVLEAMLPYFSEQFGNAGSHTHLFGWQAKAAVDKARKQVADFMGCEDSEIIFTGGATEAINLAIKGVAAMYQKKGKHIIISRTEHKAVLDTCFSLEKKGFEISLIDIDPEGYLDLLQFKATLRPDTILACVMLANNETGVIQAIENVSELCRQNNTLLFCDTTQACGKIRVDVKAYGMAMACISAHKLYGPKGAGALYVSRKDPRVYLEPLLDGGGQEKGLRSGTLNVPGIVGLGAACQLAGELMWEESARVSALRGKLEHRLLDFEGLRINGGTKNRLYNTSNLCFSGMRALEIMRRFPHLAMATGSACTSAQESPSHVLKAMGLSDADAHASLRISIGRYTTEEEIDETITCLASLYGKN